jgi:hypothetical protein
MVRVRNVCFARGNGVGGADGRATSATASVHSDANETVAQLCGRLTGCHTPAAFARCAGYRAGDDAASAFLESALGGVRAAAGPVAGYPVAGARVYRRGVVLTLTGNIGHDLYNGLLDAFAQGERDGKPFDAVVADVNWFSGLAAFERALEAPATSWSMTVSDALFNGTSAKAPLYFAAHPAMREPNAAFFGDAAFCVDDLYVRGQGLLAENVGWDALAHIPALRDRVLERVLGGAPTAAGDVVGPPASPRAFFFS